MGGAPAPMIPGTFDTEQRIRAEVGKTAPIPLTLALSQGRGNRQVPELQAITIIRDGRVFIFSDFCRMARYESHRARHAARLRSEATARQARLFAQNYGAVGPRSPGSYGAAGVKTERMEG
jgi:hypothetical protein